MDYKNDDIEFANRLLTRREELNDEEVTAWLKEKDHVELLDEIAAIRQKLSGQSYGENDEEEFLHLEKSIYDQKSRRMTLRWSIAASIILLVGLFVGRTINEVRDMHEEQELAKNVMQPGTSKAILMMADGKEVVLEQGQNLNILLNERVRVATSSQGIVYEEHGKGVVTEEYNKLTTPIGGEYSLVLSDGTKVFLNADSELKYPVEFSDGKRIVDLKGEAYFEVHKDSLRPFVVRMNGAEVTVLGTSFNVNTYGDDGQIYTTLVNGSVRVSSVKNGQAEVLKPGMQSVMDVQSGQLTVREVDVEPYVAWREGRFVFRTMTLDLIMRQLQRWYDFEVFYQNPELKDYEFRGVIKRDMDLDKVLSVIKVTTNVDFEVKGKVITIIKR
ncbi:MULTISPECIES: FecR family protein [Butyricimonas]|uniref:FecR family protein n=1 Tax=Butyricimonas TaxID=574697 RepID=UPI002088E233|nr:FecR family protein [Butyricimonas paravirosa]BDF52587.1 iron dicitrate transporter FecR [Odoribacteraceae bacterium]GKH91526.1 iron dicitrate transporter FecR [Odoribacteraceae bacterium]GKH96144.1 iron dicitrate transporter FecR [Odoribacteraceae bacterium]GKI03022.1 iron dicitrate transporter FecR [Odoribacteraceae bacterium]